MVISKIERNAIIDYRKFGILERVLTLKYSIKSF